MRERGEPVGAVLASERAMQNFQNRVIAKMQNRKLKKSSRRDFFLRERRELVKNFGANATPSESLQALISCELAGLLLHSTV
jgi:hypothetical protein